MSFAGEREEELWRERAEGVGREKVVREHPR